MGENYYYELCGIAILHEPFVSQFMRMHGLALLSSAGIARKFLHELVKAEHLILCFNQFIEVFSHEKFKLYFSM